MATTQPSLPNNLSNGHTRRPFDQGPAGSLAIPTSKAQDSPSSWKTPAGLFNKRGLCRTQNVNTPTSVDPTILGNAHSLIKSRPQSPPRPQHSIQLEPLKFSPLERNKSSLQTDCRLTEKELF